MKKEYPTQGTIIELRDKKALAHYFQKDIALHIYEIGDLDPFFWPHTQWYGWREGNELRAAALLYDAPDNPTLLALTGEADSTFMLRLLEHMAPRLPDRFYSHMSPGLADILIKKYRAVQSIPHLKMILRDTSRLPEIDRQAVELLSPENLDEILAFYSAGYPDNWFDPRMLETRQYFGIRKAGKLVSAAGVHVYSPKYRVAALGNIAVLPSFRGLGLGKIATSALCLSLLETTPTIGLNVRADNIAAVQLYLSMGFEKTAEYDEIIFTIK